MKVFDHYATAGVWYNPVTQRVLSAVVAIRYMYAYDRGDYYTFLANTNLGFICWMKVNV